MTTFIRAFLFILLLGLAAQSYAQQVTGSFIAYADDHATIFVNGTKVFHLNLGTARSNEITLRAGDTIVVHLRNDHGPKGFLLAFASSDGKTVASFRSGDYKIIPAEGLTNFTPAQFAAWPKHASSVRRDTRDNALDKMAKNYSDSVWGDASTCSLASIVTPKMFAARPQ